MTFDCFVGHDDAKLALILNAVDPRCGGALFIGEKGTGKSTLMRQSKSIFAADRPFVNLPLNATEDALLGGIDLEKAVRQGRPVRRDGLLRQAAGGIIHIDDVNLLPPEIMALVLKGQERANEAVADAHPDGRMAPAFALLASMNPEEGVLSPHFLDRFGLCVVWERLKEPAQKVAVMKAVLNAEAASQTGGETLQRLQTRIQDARAALRGTVVPTEMKDAMIRTCLENAVAGHRGDLFLYYAARACAAFQGDREVSLRHLEAVFPLVLLHRKRVVERMKEEEAQNQRRRDTPEDENHEPEPDRESREDVPGNREGGGDDAGREDAGQVRERHGESGRSEEIFDMGDPFRIRRLAFRKDRVLRAVSGRRTKTGSLGKRGRHIRSILKPNDDIALDATLRAAAPFQLVRGRRDMLLIRREDIRYRQRERRMGHLVILVVDGSGSMGVRKRMTETKGAVQSLLLDCYQKRDRVSLIVFRREAAEVVLPPTSSLETASRRLREIPVGGKTPLAAGLLAAYNLVRQVRMKSLETRCLIVLVTDGRANQSLSDLPIQEELQRIAGLLCTFSSTDHIVIDTEDKRNFLKADLAREVAAMLGADYYRIDDLKATHLTEIVRSKTAAGRDS